MFLHKKTDFYSSNLNAYIAQTSEGAPHNLPLIFCVFAENSDNHKVTAANFLCEFLNKLSFDDIYRIDKQMRQTTSMEWSINWKELNVESFVTKHMSEDEKRAVFVFASFHPNGYIREQAIYALGKYKDTLPFILLRCNDWVCQVRQAAFNVFTQILAYSSEEEIVHALPLMEKLRRSTRYGYDTILPVVVNLFRINGQLIKRGLNSTDFRARKFCISIINHLDKIDNDYLMDYIFHEKDPFLRKTVFQILLKTNADSTEILELSKCFLKDKYPPNRILALQYLIDNHSNDLFDIAKHMLMDKNAQVRAFSRNLISLGDTKVDIRQIYLNHLYVNTSISIYGLGEVGSAEDCELIEKYLADDRVSVVRAAMTALMRLNTEKYLANITDMLAADKSGIVKTAAILLKLNREYDFEKVSEILNNSSNENTKIKCATLLFLSGKWQSLIYTLMLLGSGCEKLENLCQTQISRWIFTYNRSYAVLSKNDKQTIIELLQEKAKYLKPEAKKQIMFLAK
jgi:HEAT repeat protein